MEKTRKSGKGIVTAVLSGVIVIGIFVFGIILSSILPFLFLRVHFVETIVFKYNYDNAQQTLLTLMSLTKTDTIDGEVKPASKIVAEYLTMSSNKPDISFLGAELNKMVEHEIFNCYKLSADGNILAKLDCTKPNREASEYVASTIIATPETKSKLTLAIE